MDSIDEIFVLPEFDELSSRYHIIATFQSYDFTSPDTEFPDRILSRSCFVYVANHSFTLSDLLANIPLDYEKILTENIRTEYNNKLYYLNHYSEDVTDSISFFVEISELENGSLVLFGSSGYKEERVSFALRSFYDGMKRKCEESGDFCRGREIDTRGEEIILCLVLSRFLELNVNKYGKFN